MVDPDRPDDLQARVDAAWRDFVVDMQHQYPADEWPVERLQMARASLLGEAEREIERGEAAERIGNSGLASERYVEAAEYRRDANGIAALLIDKGDLVMEGDAQTTLEFLERAVQGQTDAPRWEVTTRHPETGEKGSGVVIQPEQDALADALWEQAVKYADAMPHDPERVELADPVQLAETRYRDVMRLQEEHRAPDGAYLVQEPEGRYEREAFARIANESEVAIYPLPQDRYNALVADWVEWSGARLMLTVDNATQHDISMDEVPAFSREQVGVAVIENRARAASLDLTEQEGLSSDGPIMRGTSFAVVNQIGLGGLTQQVALQAARAEMAPVDERSVTVDRSVDR